MSSATILEIPASSAALGPEPPIIDFLPTPENENQVVLLPLPDLSEKPPNAAERNFSDIDFKTYLFSTFALCTIRSIILHPLFIIVTRKQVCSETGTKSFFDLGRSMIRDEGGVFKAFTQGMFVMVSGSAISETVHNGIFEYGRYTLEKQDATSSTATAAAGAAWGADWTSRLVFSPFNVIAVRQMTFHCHEKSPAPTAEELKVNRKKMYFQNNKTGHMVRESYRANGMRSFFSGIGFNLFVGSFTSSIFFAVYLRSKEIAYSRFSNTFKEIEEEKRLAEQHHKFHLEREQSNLLSDALFSNLDLVTDPQDSSSKIITTTPFTVPSSKISTPWYHHLPNSFVSSTDNFLLNSTASIFASLASSFLANPYFVLLGKVQVGKADNVREAFKLVLRERGMQGFFRGAIAGTFATVFENFLASTTYEMAMKIGVVKNES